MLWSGCIALLRKANASRHEEVVVATPGTAGSLGDQALMQGIWLGFAKPAGYRVRQVLLPGFDPIPTDPPSLTPKPVSGHSFVADLKFLWTLRRAHLFCVPGADVMDGVYDGDQALAYMHLCDLAVKAGVKARIFGFSFSSRPSPAVVERFKTLSPKVACCVRDPASLTRFQQMTGRKGELVADLAFLLEPELRASGAIDVAEWILSERRGAAEVGEHRAVVAINANALTKLAPKETIVDTFIGLIENLCSVHAQLRFILAPHDFRYDSSDASVNREIYRRLNAAARERVRLLDSPFDSWDAKYIIGKCDLLVTGRMHLAVAALGMGVPVIGIDYNDKFPGLFGYFGVESLALDGTQAYQAGGLQAMIEETLPRCAEIRQLLALNLGQVRALSARNFDRLPTAAAEAPAYSRAF